jgi:hypothetical protein
MSVIAPTPQQLSTDVRNLSLQRAAAINPDTLPEVLTVTQWIDLFSPFIKQETLGDVTSFSLDEEAAGGAAASVYGANARMSCAAFNAQDSSVRSRAGLADFTAIDGPAAFAGSEQARFTAYWWGATIWCNHQLCIDLENDLDTVVGVVNIVSKLSSLLGPVAGTALSVVCGALVFAAGAYSNALKWADGKCQAANINFTWISVATPWISQPC